MHARQRSIFLPRPFRRLLCGYRADGGRSGQRLFERYTNHRDSLEKERFHRADSQIGMEAPLHHAAVQQVVERQHRHALVMRHVGIDHHPAISAALALEREVDGLVEPHRSAEPELLQHPDVLCGFGGIDREGQHGRVRRHHQVVGQRLLQSQRRDSESAVLIDLVGVEGAIGGFGNAPRDFLLFTVFDLLMDGLMASLIQQRVRESAHEQQRHQVLEHRPAPRKQCWSIRCAEVRSTERKPVLDGHVALGDGDHTRQAALARHQVVVAGKLKGTSNQVPDPEQSPVPVIEETHIHARG